MDTLERNKRVNNITTAILERNKTFCIFIALAFIATGLGAITNNILLIIIGGLVFVVNWCAFMHASHIIEEDIWRFEMDDLATKLNYIVGGDNAKRN